MAAQVPVGMAPYWAHHRKMLALTPARTGSRIREKLRGWFEDHGAAARYLLADEVVQRITSDLSLPRLYVDERQAAPGDLLVVRDDWHFRREERDGRDGCICYLRGKASPSTVPRVAFWVAYEHCVGSTGRTRLSGHRHCAVVGWRVDGSHQEFINPIAIGDLVIGAHDDPQRIYFSDNQYELDVREIDQFGQVDFSKRAPKSALERVQAMLESEVKAAFGHVFGEPFLDKDHPAERSDIFTARATVRGQSVPFAFVLKARGTPRKLTLANLGKNGDQVNKALTEPAGVVAVVHTGQVNSVVRRHLDDSCFVSTVRRGDPRRWVVIDGESLARILHQLDLLT